MTVLVRQLRQETGCTGAATAHTFDFQQVTHGVHWRVQVGENAQAPPHYTKCINPPVNGQCTNHHIAV